MLQKRAFQLETRPQDWTSVDPGAQIRALCWRAVTLAPGEWSHVQEDGVPPLPPKPWSRATFPTGPSCRCGPPPPILLLLPWGGAAPSSTSQSLPDRPAEPQGSGLCQRTADGPLRAQPEALLLSGQSPSPSHPVLPFGQDPSPPAPPRSFLWPGPQALVGSLKQPPCLGSKTEGRQRSLHLP